MGREGRIVDPDIIWFCGANALVRGRPPGRPCRCDQKIAKPGEGARRGSGDPPYSFHARPKQKPYPLPKAFAV